MESINLTWAGGEHAFLLSVDLLRALQDRCDAGPPLILARLRAGAWTVSDVTETIRLGLEGGGLDKEQARKLTKQFVEDRPLMESVLTATAVMVHTLYGPAGEANGDLSTESAQGGIRPN